MFVIDGHKRVREASFDSLSTTHLIEMHERHFGRLDSRAKQRIIADARLRGWDRTWNDVAPEIAERELCRAA
jgi:hypothetical protein